MSHKLGWGWGETAFCDLPLWVGFTLSIHFLISLASPVLLEKYLRDPYFVPGVVLSALQFYFIFNYPNNPVGLVLPLVLLDR